MRDSLARGHEFMNAMDLAAEMAKRCAKPLDGRAVCPAKRGDKAGRSHFAVRRIWTISPATALQRLENEPHFLRLCALYRIKSSHTKYNGFMNS
jgi:hypothetical protein